MSTTTMTTTMTKRTDTLAEFNTYMAEGSLKEAFRSTFEKADKALKECNEYRMLRAKALQDGHALLREGRIAPK